MFDFLKLLTEIILMSEKKLKYEKKILYLYEKKKFRH